MPNNTKTHGRPAALLVAAVAFAGLCAAPLHAAEDVNRIVLRVNDQILTLHDYAQRKDAEVTAILASPQISAADRQEYLSQLGPRIMQEMFRELLLMSRAKQLRIFISDQEVDEAVQEMVRSRGIQDQDTFLQALEASDMTLEGLREKMRREMTWNQVIGRDVTSAIDVGEEDLRAYYRTHKEEFEIPEKRWLKEVIVLEASGEDGTLRDAAELRQSAEEIRAKLEEGGEFEAVIEPYRSEGLTTGVIDLDWLRPDELDPTLAEVAFQLQPGAYSAPVESRGGLHIIHLAGLEEARLRPFEEVQGAILQRERGRLFDQELRNYLGELERTAYVQEDLPPEAVGYRSLAADYVPEREIQLFRQESLPVAAEPSQESETSE